MSKIFSEKNTVKELIEHALINTGLWEHEKLDDFICYEEREIDSIINWAVEEIEAVAEKRLEELLEQKGIYEESEALTLEERNK